MGIPWGEREWLFPFGVPSFFPRQLADTQSFFFCGCIDDQWSQVAKFWTTS
jgi:hypothetical protein